MPAMKGRSELGVALLMVALGAGVLWDASRINTGFTQRGPVGPKAMPMLISTMLLVCAALLAYDVLRGGHGKSDTGEDIDLTHGSDWRAVLLVTAAFLANAALIEPAGWVVSGTVLFWGTAYALGSRHWARDPLVAIALSVVTFYLFVVGLGINLPAGILQGIL